MNQENIISNTDIKLQFYNSRTKKIDIFKHDKSIPINMYTCGPTVYERVHLGLY